MGKPSKDYAVPLWEKANLTVYEAAAYSGIGADKLRELTDREDCEFVLWNGTKRLIKRKKLDEFLERAYSIYQSTMRFAKSHRCPKRRLSVS